MAETYGDKLAKVLADETAIAKNQSDLAAIGAELDANTKKYAVDKADLGAVVKGIGGFYHVNADGSATVVEPDGNGSYLTRQLLPDTTEVPVPPAPSA